MSREIKFKAFVNNQLHGIGVYPVRNINFYPFTCQVEIDGELISFFDFDNLKLIQFTGLKDKNGKEIFEGDIVKTHDQNNVIEYEHGSFLVKGLHADEYERTYSVLYHYLVDATIPDMPHSRFDGVTTDLEIIGNIYENPKLLEETA